MSFLDNIVSSLRKSRDVVTFTTVTHSHEGYLVHSKITGIPVYDNKNTIQQRRVTVEHTRLNVNLTSKYSTIMSEDEFQKLRFQVAK